MKSFLLICPTCGNRKRVPECRAHLRHCSRRCYLESLQLDAEQVKRMARMGMSRTASAKTLEIPFRTFYRKLRVQGLNDLYREARN